MPLHASMEQRLLRKSGEPGQLVVDIGNTTTMLALFGHGPDPLIEKVSTTRFSEQEVMESTLDSLFERNGLPDQIAICSVVPATSARCIELLESTGRGPVTSVSASLNLPFRLDYENRETFGADRIAICTLSCTMFPGQTSIAVDIGTAITFDVLDATGAYIGGLIMPGIDMMAGALHARTAQLPLVDISTPPVLLGKSTEQCIRSGIFWGTVKEVGGLIEEITGHLREKLGETEIRVLVTGGNSTAIASEIGGIDVVDPLAVVRGSRLLLKMNG